MATKKPTVAQEIEELEPTVEELMEIEEESTFVEKTFVLAQIHSAYHAGGGVSAPMPGDIDFGDYPSELCKTFVRFNDDGLAVCHPGVAAAMIIAYPKELTLRDPNVPVKVLIEVKGGE